MIDRDKELEEKRFSLLSSLRRAKLALCESTGTERLYIQELLNSGCLTQREVDVELADLDVWDKYWGKIEQQYQELLAKRGT